MGKNNVLAPIHSRDVSTNRRVYATCMKCGNDLVVGNNDKEVYKKCPEICPFCGQRLKPKEDEV